MIVLVMGVSGAGKSTIGCQLAQIIGGDFIEGDDFHSSENIIKMKSGSPLTDADRKTWLDRLANELAIASHAKKSAVLACSVLKQAYRDQLLARCPQARILWLYGPAEVISARLHTRRGHFMPPELLISQLAALEPPDDAIAIEVTKSPETVIIEALRCLDLSQS
ncbi:MAG: gluconokinase [Gammaproteobacteria bacterium]|nr:gluconokinase [Gammaproteobacteria bacterium]